MHGAHRRICSGSDIVSVLEEEEVVMIPCGHTGRKKRASETLQDCLQGPDGSFKPEQRIRMCRAEQQSPSRCGPGHCLGFRLFCKVA